MALQLSKTLDSGFSANYWRVISFSIRRLADNSASLEVLIALYKDSASRSAGKDSVHVRSEQFSITSAESDDNLIALAYTKVKALSDFSGAQDV